MRLHRAPGLGPGAPGPPRSGGREMRLHQRCSEPKGGCLRAHVMALHIMSPCFRCQKPSSAPGSPELQVPPLNRSLCSITGLVVPGALPRRALSGGGCRRSAWRAFPGCSAISCGRGSPGENPGSVRPCSGLAFKPAAQPAGLGLVDPGPPLRHGLITCSWRCCWGAQEGEFSGVDAVSFTVGFHWGVSLLRRVKWNPGEWAPLLPPSALLSPAGVQEAVGATCSGGLFPSVTQIHLLC